MSKPTDIIVHWQKQVLSHHNKTMDLCHKCYSGLSLHCNKKRKLMSQLLSKLSLIVEYNFRLKHKPEVTVYKVIAFVFYLAAASLTHLQPLMLMFIACANRAVEWLEPEGKQDRGHIISSIIKKYYEYLCY